MLNATGKYVSVFNPTMNFAVSERIVFADITTSKKNESDGDISYENMRWKARFVGEALEPAKSLRNKDKIDILRGAVSNHYSKESQKAYYEVTVFEFAMSDVRKDTGNSATVPLEASQYVGAEFAELANEDCPF